jgi:hypothetical protein
MIRSVAEAFSTRVKIAASAAAGAIVGAALLVAYVVGQRRLLEAEAPVAKPSSVVGAPAAEPTQSDAPSAPPAPAIASLDATAIGSLSTDACIAELRRRQVPFEEVDPSLARSVRQPMRITGPIGGVELRPTGLASSAKPHPYDIADCRLVVALSELAGIAREQNIVAIEFFGMYRPTRSRGPSSVGRHEEGLAIDIGAIHLDQAEPLIVKEAFEPRLGKRPCPPKVDAPDDYGAQALRSFACRTYDARVFNVVLTPNEGPSHHDHFHFDVTPSATWFHLE